MDTSFPSGVLASGTAALIGCSTTKSSGELEHAVTDEVSLCGIPRADLMVMRHLWRSNEPQACPECRTALLPSRPPRPADS